MAMFALLLAIAGCRAEPTRAGMTLDDAEELLRSMPGVRGAQVKTRSTLDGFTRQTPITVKLELADSFEVVAAPQLADFLVRLLWSVDGARPTRLVVSVSSAAGDGVDVSAGARASGWHPIMGSREQPLFVIEDLDDEPAKSKLGPWPGPVPVPPTDAIAPIAGSASAQRSRSAKAWIAATMPSVSKEPSALRVKWWACIPASRAPSTFASESSKRMAFSGCTPNRPSARV